MPAERKRKATDEDHGPDENKRSKPSNSSGTKESAAAAGSRSSKPSRKPPSNAASRRSTRRTTKADAQSAPAKKQKWVPAGVPSLPLPKRRREATPERETHPSIWDIDLQKESAYIYDINRTPYYWPHGPHPGESDTLDRIACYMGPFDKEWKRIPPGLTIPNEFRERWLKEIATGTETATVDEPPRHRNYRPPAVADNGAEDDDADDYESLPCNQELYLQQQAAKKAKQGGNRAYVGVPPPKHTGKGKGKAKAPPSPEASEDEILDEAESEFESDSKDETYDPYEGRRIQSKKFAVENEESEQDEEEPEQDEEHREPEQGEEYGELEEDNTQHDQHEREDGMDVDNEASAVDNQVIFESAKPGRPTNLFKDDCADAAERVMELVDFLVAKHQCSRNQVFTEMGIGPRATEYRESGSCWNAWVSYFYLEHPLQPEEDPAQHRKEMSELYQQMVAGLDDIAKDQFAKDLKAIVESMQDNHKGHPALIKKAAAARQKHAENQVMKLVLLLSRMDPIIESAGVILSVSNDPDARALPGVAWVSSSRGKRVIEANNLNVEQMVQWAKDMYSAEHAREQMVSLNAAAPLLPHQAVVAAAGPSTAKAAPAPPRPAQAPPRHSAAAVSVPAPPRQPAVITAPTSISAPAASKPTKKSRKSTVVIYDTDDESQGGGVNNSNMEKEVGGEDDASEEEEGNATFKDQDRQRGRAKSLYEFKKMEPMKSQVNWQRLVYLFYENEWRCENWPKTQVPPFPGSAGFNSKSITAKQWAFFGRQVDNNMQLLPGATKCFRFVKWTDEEKCIPKGSAEHLKIALVTNLKGEPLLTVGDIISPNVTLPAAAGVAPVQTSATTAAPRIPPVKASATTAAPRIPPVKDSATTAAPRIPPVKASNTTAAPRIPPVKASNVTAAPRIPPVKASNATAAPRIPPVKASNATASAYVGPILASYTGPATLRYPFSKPSAATSAASSLPQVNLSSKRPLSPSRVIQGRTPFSMRDVMEGPSSRPDPKPRRATSDHLEPSKLFDIVKKLRADQAAAAATSTSHLIPHRGELGPHQHQKMVTMSSATKPQVSDVFYAHRSAAPSARPRQHTPPRPNQHDEEDEIEEDELNIRTQG